MKIHIIKHHDYKVFENMVNMFLEQKEVYESKIDFDIAYTPVEDGTVREYIAFITYRGMYDRQL